jgi:hypothetical protein
MSTTTFALVFGIGFTLAGIIGMFPAALSPPPPEAPALSFNVLYGYLLGLFPVNLAHSVVHLVIGVAGLAAAGAERHARLYARGVAVFYGALGVLGLMPGPNTLFGLLPLHGHDIWLHLGSAALASYFGWRAEIPLLSERDDRRYGIADRRQTMSRVASERRSGAYDRRMPLGT